MGRAEAVGRAAAVSERTASDRPVPRPHDSGRGDDRHAADGYESAMDSYIARLLDDAPALSREQRDTLALILRRPRRGLAARRFSGTGRPGSCVRYSEHEGALNDQGRLGAVDGFAW
jgi:hypothetical protein